MRRVQIGRVIATVDDGEWTSDDAHVAGMLGTIDLDGERAYLPDPDLAFARKAARVFGGRVLDSEADEPVLPHPADMTL
jgi:hypothetical protein